MSNSLNQEFVSEPQIYNVVIMHRLSKKCSDMEEDMDRVYTVSQVNQYIKSLFTRDYALNQIYIKGEVSNCKYHTSGHIYFTLKDEIGQMACVMFARQRAGLSFLLQNGQSVVVFGSINVYERDGKYQLYAAEIILDGIGVLYEKLEQLKEQLYEEGLFSEIYKKKVPTFASRIGVVTAKTGAVIQDIQNIAYRRNPYIQLILYPAKVQGEGAAATIVKGIKQLDKLGLDVIIIGRGGGSIEDLWAFNEEVVARAVFEADTPIISAVGHETDITITDYVADLRAPTPSAAAELAVFPIEELFDMFRQAKLRLLELMQQKITNNRKEIKTYQLKLEYQNPVYQIRQNRQFLIESEERLNRLIKQQIKEKRQYLELAVLRFEAINPLEKLKQGYAYVEKERQAVRSIKELQTDDVITIYFSDGKAVAQITQLDLNRGLLDGKRKLESGGGISASE